jgi:HlyD family secretion protein
VQNVVIYTTIVSIENPRLELLPGMTANLRIETDRRDDAVRIPNAALRWRPPSIVPEAAPAPEAASAALSRRGGGGAMRITELAEAIKADLDLSAEQIKEIDAAVADMRKTSAGGDQDQPGRREGGRIARQDLEGRIVAILNDGQRTKFETIRKRLAENGGGYTQVGRIFVTGRDGNPQGMTVRIGATDGGMTEIVSGLDAGRDVIIGGGPRADAAASRRPRFGF